MNLSDEGAKGFSRNGDHPGKGIGEIDQFGKSNIGLQSPFDPKARRHGLAVSWLVVSDGPV
jgi:hypothetical protein